MVDDHPGPGFLFDAEEPQLAAQAAVVPALGLFQELQVLFELLGGGKGGAVDALQHLPVLVAPPVGPGGGGELEGLQQTGGRDMGAAAKIQEIPLAVEADPALGQRLDDLYLIILVPDWKKAGAPPLWRPRPG